MLGFVTKLSSAGLVYKHFGKELVAAATRQPADSPTVETTWLAVYKYFMEAVDGIDNGMHNVVVCVCPSYSVHLLCECWTCSQNTLLSVAAPAAQVAPLNCLQSCRLLAFAAADHGPEQLHVFHPASPGLTMPHHASPGPFHAGINQYESDKPARYVSNTNLSSRVANLNPPWNGDQSEQASDAQFQKAMQLTGHEFMEALDYYSNVSICTAHKP